MLPTPLSVFRISVDPEEFDIHEQLNGTLNIGRNFVPASDNYNKLFYTLGATNNCLLSNPSGQAIGL